MHGISLFLIACALFNAVVPFSVVGVDAAIQKCDGADKCPDGPVDLHCIDDGNFTTASTQQPLALLTATARSSSQQVRRACESWLKRPEATTAYRNALSSLAVEKSRPSSLRNLPCLLSQQRVDFRDTPAEAYANLITSSFHPSILYNMLKQSMESILKKNSETDDHAGLSWPGAYVCEAALVAYEKTRDVRFLDLFVDYFERILKRRDDKTGKFDVYHQRRMKAWGSKIGEATPRWIAHITSNARIVYPATMFAKIIAENSNLKPRYQKTATAYVQVAVEVLTEFDSDWRTFTNYSGISWYVSPYLERAEPTNHMHIVGNCWLNLAELTRNTAFYQQRIAYVIETFLKGVQTTTSSSKGAAATVRWNYFPYFATEEMKLFRNGQEYSEYVWKASLTAPFLLRAKQRGYAVPPTLLTSIANTFFTLTFQERGVLRNLSPVGSRFFSLDTDAAELSMLQNVLVLVEYQQVNRKLGESIARVVGERSGLFPNGWLSGAPGLLAYAHLLE